MTDLFSYLSDRPYPGRGILLGYTRHTTDLLPRMTLAYFIMGRSENSRNRIFTRTDSGIRTEPVDMAKLTDPSLIIYHPVRQINGCTIVTNGDQTDTIRDYLQSGLGFEDALRTRTFEPDAPNYTPRISGILYPDGHYALSILKPSDGDPVQTLRCFYLYETPKLNMGHFISTYEGYGSPLPAFSGEPITVQLPNCRVELLADALWDALDDDNRVSLFVSLIDPRSGARDSVIINQFGNEEAERF